MKENQVQSNVESTEPRASEKKNYHPPELTEYGDIREMTLTNNPTAPTFDGGTIPFTEVTTL